MKKFINDPFDVVDEMLEGFLDVHNAYVKRLDGARTVVRADAPVKGKVGVLTGGGSGHKPAFIGFIGKGMLDAVAVGEIFTSPPPLAVFEGAKAVNGGKGIVFLLGNYGIRFYSVSRLIHVLHECPQLLYSPQIEPRFLPGSTSSS